MPRYFFDIYDGVNMIDDEGLDLADADAARAEALAAAGSMLKEETGGIWDGTPWKMQVRDEAGLVIGTLVFTAA